MTPPPTPRRAPCPHPHALRVGGLCYWDIKQKAMNGGRSKLSAEQLGFVGVVSEHEHDEPNDLGHRGRSWLEAVTPSTIDKLLEELERRLDLAPNWVAFARALIEEKGNTS
jgi:hypothetical protein